MKEACDHRRGALRRLIIVRRVLRYEGGQLKKANVKLQGSTLVVGIHESSVVHERSNETNLCNGASMRKEITKKIIHQTSRAPRVCT